MFSAVVIGDLHLDGMQADLGEEANRLQIREIGKIEAWASANSISHVIYLGDICQRTTMSYEAHKLLHAQWSKNTHLKRHVIIGNHDFAENGVHSLTLLKDTILPALPHVFVYDSMTTVVIEGVQVNFLPYPYPDIEWDGDLENSINVSHFEVKGSIRDNGSSSSSKKGVMSNSVWMMGHLHTPHDVGNVHYVGTPYQRNFGESLPKSFTWLRARMNKGVLQTKIERVPLDPTFKLITLDIQSDEDLQAITDDPLNKYKLVISQAVSLTDNFLAKHPNVVRHDGYRNQKEREMMLSSIDISQIVDQGNPYDIEDYVESKYPDSTEKQKLRAKQIVNEIKAELEE